MNIEEKYRLEYLKNLFIQLSKFVNDPNLFMDISHEDPYFLGQISDILKETFGYSDIDEIDYLFAAFVENYQATNGDFSKLGETIKPVTPKLKTFKIIEYKTCEILIDTLYTAEGYNKAIAMDMWHTGNIDADDEIQDIKQCYDDVTQVTIEEMPIEDKKNIDEDLEYWETNTEGPEDDQYNMGPS